MVKHAPDIKIKANLDKNSPPKSMGSSSRSRSNDQVPIRTFKVPDDEVFNDTRMKLINRTVTFNEIFANPNFSDEQKKELRAIADQVAATKNPSSQGASSENEDKVELSQIMCA